MSSSPKIDFVGPPFAGHLFPLIELADGLRARGLNRLRVLSTASAHAAIQAAKLDAVELLAGHEATILGIANPGHQVGSNPLRMLRQFQANLSLMAQLRDELTHLWKADRPDVVFADFTVPMAGLTAEKMGIRWWTGITTPCALETPGGTPSYLGGWFPRDDWLGRLRDRLGWAFIRAFKQGVRLACARQFRELGIESVYRPDRSEVAYSSERILGYGMREFEFDRPWPGHFEFIGPLTRAPELPPSSPSYSAGKRHVLVTLGTHVLWAKQNAAQLIEQVATRFPDCVFHFSHGKPGGALEQRDNVHYYDFLPYDRYLDRYELAITHGGTGIVYACIQNGVPSLVWPQDYDHFDHAARVVHRGLGLRLVPSVATLADQIRRLLDDRETRSRVREFQALSQRYDPSGRLYELVRDR